MKNVVALILLSFVLPAQAMIRPNAVYVGESYNDEDESEECTIEIGHVRILHGKVAEFSAKVGAQAFHKDLKKVYENNGRAGYSNAPESAFAGNDGGNFFDMARSWSHLLMGSTLNVELDADGNLLSAEYFGRLVMGAKEYLCDFE